MFSYNAQICWKRLFPYSDSVRSHGVTGTQCPDNKCSRRSPPLLARRWKTPYSRESIAKVSSANITCRLGRRADLEPPNYPPLAMFTHLESLSFLNRYGDSYQRLDKDNLLLDSMTQTITETPSSLRSLDVFGEDLQKCNVQRLSSLVELTLVLLAGIDGIGTIFAHSSQLRSLTLSVGELYSGDLASVLHTLQRAPAPQGHRGGLSASMNISPGWSTNWRLDGLDGWRTASAGQCPKRTTERRKSSVAAHTLVNVPVSHAGNILITGHSMGAYWHLAGRLTIDQVLRIHWIMHRLWQVSVSGSTCSNPLTRPLPVSPADFLGFNQLVK